ncbi:MAG: transposase [Nitrososphaera sp.]|nr:transposase [Nitrososphaera sp.]
MPIVTPAPIVQQHAEAFGDLFENRCQFSHFQNYLTGLIVLDNKTLTNISRCLVESADKTNMSRFFSQAPWFESEINERRITIMLEQTASHRLKAEDSCLIIDDTLCEHVGSLFEYVARHYDHCENRYPIAHNLVTSHYISGAVRFPIDACIYRRYEEKTCWEAFVKKHFPDREIPTKKKERQLLHKEVDAVLLKDPEFALLAEEFQTKITIATQLIEEGIKRGLSFQTVLIDSWYLSQDLVASLKAKQKDWVSLLKRNRKLETASFTLRDEQGKKVSLEGPHIKVEQLVEMIPSKAYKKATVKGKDYWYFALNVRVPDLGKVRIVISYDNEKLSGTYAVLITNRRDWSAKKIIETYLQRWPIETFYQDSKGHLGLNEYRMRKAEAIKKHWCLVFVAYSLLHLDCLEASPMKRKKESQPIKTIGEACRQQGQALIERLIMISHELMQQGESAAEVFCKLFAKQQPVAAM